MDPDLKTNRRWYCLIVGLAVVPLVGLLVGAGVGLAFGQYAGMVCAGIVALGGAVLAGQLFRQPIVDAAPKVRTRFSDEFDMNFGRPWDWLVTIGLLAYVALGVVVACGSVGLLLEVRMNVLLPVTVLAVPLGVSWMIIGGPGSESVMIGSPTRFTNKPPDAVLTASRNSGLIFGFVHGSGAALAVGVVSAWALAALVDSQESWAQTLNSVLPRYVGGEDGDVYFGLFAGLVAFLLVGWLHGLSNGLDAWLYHHWLRWRLDVHNRLPRHLPQFLSWCADHERQWLRVTNAYECRHRELLEHLAPAELVNPLDACPLSVGELDVLKGLAEGKAQDKIAQELQVSYAAVSEMRFAIRGKLGAGWGWMSDDELVEVANDRGWL